MEPTTNLNEAVDNPRSRRALLAGAVGGVGAWLVSAAQRAMPAEAAAGDPLRIGQVNSGGGASTELRATTTKPVFRAVQLGGGTALRGESPTGHAAILETRSRHKFALIARNASTSLLTEAGAILAEAKHQYGVLATTDTGVGVIAISHFGGTAVSAIAERSGGTAILCLSLDEPGSYALRASGPTELAGQVDIFGNMTISQGITLSETTLPPQPSADQLGLFARDNGLGKTELCVQFATGAVQVLATEP
jgi:hypothetical protein